MVAGGAVDIEVIFSGARKGDGCLGLDAAKVGDDVADLVFRKIGQAGRSHEGAHRGADAAVLEGLEDVVVGGDREETRETDTGARTAGGVAGPLLTVAGSAVGLVGRLAAGRVSGEGSRRIGVDGDGMVIASGVEVSENRVDLLVTQVGPGDHRGSGAPHADRIPDEVVTGNGEEVAVADARGETNEAGGLGLVAGCTEGVVDLFAFPGEGRIRSRRFWWRRCFFLLRRLGSGCCFAGLVGRVSGSGAEKLAAEDDGASNRHDGEDNEEAAKSGVGGRLFGRE
jgi:hypothetical protein